MSRFIKINHTDVANGPGVRHSIFLSGCDFHCKGCFNESTWDFKAGTPLDWAGVWDFITTPVLDQNIAGISILGGEPLHPKNINTTLDICIGFRRYENTVLLKNPDFKKKSIWLWTGYTLEEILSNEERIKILDCVDVLVDGRYIEELKNPNLMYRGSENQRIIDIKKLRKWSKYINTLFFKFIIRNNMKRFIIPDEKLDDYK